MRDPLISPTPLQRAMAARRAQAAQRQGDKAALRGRIVGMRESGLSTCDSRRSRRSSHHCVSLAKEMGRGGQPEGSL
ncbi:hypothetical protein Pmani_006710 [Petrolisthes manimaculis]|uniref:Uncharacterized protein n=1 Tax=Petrolisthes manimaculis TaxID=1843537 RepID=A0AAE1Q9X7_9EUCA|nr:hypothetical protein Pmani_006710 [Petrolisthes manimaculis]